jgi:hypothetical protein
MKTSRFSLALLAVVFLGTVGDPFRALAATVVFNLDPARSSITLSGSVLNNALKEQGPGSLTTSFSGTIAADVAGSTIQFIGGSAIDAQTNGNWQPQASGVAGSEQDDHAVPGGELAGNFQTDALVGAGDERDAAMSLRIGHVFPWLMDARPNLTSAQIL